MANQRSTFPENSSPNWLSLSFEDENGQANNDNLGYRLDEESSDNLEGFLTDQKNPRLFSLEIFNLPRPLQLDPMVKFELEQTLFANGVANLGRIELHFCHQEGIDWVLQYCLKPAALPVPSDILVICDIPPDELDEVSKSDLWQEIKDRFIKNRNHELLDIQINHYQENEKKFTLTHCITDEIKVNRLFFDAKEKISTICLFYLESIINEQHKFFIDKEVHLRWCEKIQTLTTCIATEDLNLARLDDYIRFCINYAKKLVRGDYTTSPQQQNYYNRLSYYYACLVDSCLECNVDRLSLNQSQYNSHYINLNNLYLALLACDTELDFGLIFERVMLNLERLSAAITQLSSLQSRFEICEHLFESAIYLIRNFNEDMQVEYTKIGRLYLEQLLVHSKYVYDSTVENKAHYLKRIQSALIAAINLRDRPHYVNLLMQFYDPNHSIIDILTEFREFENLPLIKNHKQELLLVARLLKISIELFNADQLEDCHLHKYLQNISRKNALLEAITPYFSHTPHTLTNLPQELRLEIFEYLTTQDAINANQVCKQMRVELSANAYWVKKLKQDYAVTFTEDSQNTNTAKLTYKNIYIHEFKIIRTYIPNYRSLFSAIRKGDSDSVLNIFKDYPGLGRNLFFYGLTKEGKNGMNLDTYLAIAKYVSDPQPLLNNVYEEVTKNTSEEYKELKMLHAVCARQSFDTIVTLSPDTSFIEENPFVKKPILFLAIEHGNDDVVLNLLARIPYAVQTVIHTEQEDDINPIHYAALLGNVSLVIDMLKQLPLNLNIGTKYKKTLLCIAVATKNKLLIRELFKLPNLLHDAMPDKPCEEAAFSDLVAYALLGIQDLEIAKLLIVSGVKTNFATYHINKDNEQLLIKFIKYYIKWMLDIEEQDQSISDTAAISEYLMKLKFIRYTANMCELLENLKALLLVCAKYNAVALAEYLMNIYSIGWKITDAKEMLKYNIQFAGEHDSAVCVSSNLKMVMIIISGIKPNSPELTQALFAAIENNNDQDVILMLARHSAAYLQNAIDNEGKTILYRAVCNKFTDLVSLLLRAGVDTRANICNLNNSILHFAVKQRCLPIIKLLVEHDKGLLYLCNDQGETALEMILSGQAVHTLDDLPELEDVDEVIQSFDDAEIIKYLRDEMSNNNKGNTESGNEKYIESPRKRLKSLSLFAKNILQQLATSSDEKMPLKPFSLR